MSDSLPLFPVAGEQSNPLFLGASERSEHRLVKTSKSPTPVFHEFERTQTAIDSTGCKTVIEYREWQECWRVRTEVEATSGIAPPDQSGARESEMLTARGATKIAESCEYMHLKHGGFQTFVTGTFRDSVRRKIEAGETTIQKEVTRTMDALQKMYQRGWTTEQGTRVSGHNHGLPYLWVVEIPQNAQGNANPHIHMLLGWSVEFKYFAEWAHRIESIWGNGYFHLEKIKDSACAGAYMAKAAGYLTKSNQEKIDKDTGEIYSATQGVVQGNRYGISKTARAPAWLQISHAQLHTMGQLIYDIYDHLSVKYGDKYRERKALNNTLASMPKDRSAARRRIGKRLSKVRAELNQLPIRCNKYQVVIKGKVAASQFFTWLKTPTSENINTPEWLPKKLEGWEWQEGPKPSASNNQFFTKLRDKFRQQRFWRRLVVPEYIKQTFTNEYWHCVKNDYQEFETPQEPDFCLSEYYALQAA